MSKSVDKSHNEATFKTISESWKRLGYFDKLRAVINIALTIPLALLPSLLFGKNEMTKSLRKVTDHIYQLEYTTNGIKSNCIVLVGNDGTLLLRSPPPLATETLVAITNLGVPKVILASLAHDTHVDKWKEIYPNAIVMASTHDAKEVSDRANVDAVVENSEKLLLNYGITECIPSNSFTTFDDFFLIVQLDQSKRAALLPCAYVNYKFSFFSIKSWINLILGTVGPRYTRFSAYFFCRDLLKVDEMIRQVCKITGMSVFVFLHGEPEVGSQKELMDYINRGKYPTSRYLINI